MKYSYPTNVAPLTKKALSDIIEKPKNTCKIKILGQVLQTPGKHRQTILPIRGHKTVHHPRIFRLYVAVRLNT